MIAARPPGRSAGRTPRPHARTREHGGTAHLR